LLIQAEIQGIILTCTNSFSFIFSNKITNSFSFIFSNQRTLILFMN
jgi:hypothetical protein